jgi:ABC-type polysaccharide/polyol phosphate transport system ATPase subunit
MLRMMSGIYPPTRGSIEITGQVSSLLDLGLGMDPEASGLLNIRNRALFLGLSRREVDEQIDDIATFADLGEFLSYPIRTYSSGMFLRLAFAVATVSRPEIVLIDEGLGAGDAAFREKARARLDDFMGRAGILVLASHDYALLERYCTEAAVMHKGRLLFRGPLQEAHEYYKTEVVG